MAASNEARTDRLRIVHVFRAPLGGLFRHVLDLAGEQSARGHEVGMFYDGGAHCPRVEAALARIPGGLKLGAEACWEGWEMTWMAWTSALLTVEGPKANRQQQAQQQPQQPTPPRGPIPVGTSPARADRRKEEDRRNDAERRVGLPDLRVVKIERRRQASDRRAEKAERRVQEGRRAAD